MASSSPTLASHLEMDRDVKIGKISEEQRVEQKVEILTALRKLGEPVRLESTCSLLDDVSWVIRLPLTRTLNEMSMPDTGLRRKGLMWYFDPQLTPEEINFLAQHGSAALDEFDRVSENLSKGIFLLRDCTM